jgi:aspartate-semialdehyde dehydrogenase
LQYAFNIFSHNAPILENGYNEEEMKMVKETRKIWVSESLINAHKFFALLSNFLLIYLLSKQKSDPNSVLYFQNDEDVRVTATCIRVPTMRAHAESINLQFENPLDEVST